MFTRVLSLPFGHVKCSNSMIIRHLSNEFSSSIVSSARCLETAVFHGFLNLNSHLRGAGFQIRVAYIQIRGAWTSQYKLYIYIYIYMG